MMMDEIMESRCQDYQNEIKALKAECSKLAESKEMSDRTIRAMDIQNKELIGKLEQANRTIEIYEAQLDIVRMMCGVGCNKKPVKR